MENRIIKGMVHLSSFRDKITIRMVLKGRIHEGEIELSDHAMEEILTADAAGSDPVDTLVRLLQEQGQRQTRGI